MKKNKLSNAPSQNTSPVPYRKSYNDAAGAGDRQMMFASDPELAIGPIVIGTNERGSDALSKSMHATSSSSGGGQLPLSNKPLALIGARSDNDYETIDKRRSRSNSYDTKDPGYETIPAAGKKVATTDSSAAVPPPGIYTGS